MDKVLNLSLQNDDYIARASEQMMRAQYSAKQLKALGKAGKAFKNPDGSFSYPIADVQDLKNAIRAVGRGNASHNKIRLFIIKRAGELGRSDLIPSTWNKSDGSLKAA